MDTRQIMTRKLSCGRNWTFWLLIATFGIQAAQMELIRVKTAEELQMAIQRANAGDSIELLPIEYRGNFILGKFSGGINPVTLYGTWNQETQKSTTIIPSRSQSDEIAFKVNGNHWNLKSLIIKGFNTAVILEGNGNSLNGLVMDECQNGISALGDNSVIKSLVMTGTGDGFAIDLKGNDCTVESAVTKSTKFGFLVSGQRPILSSDVITATYSLRIFPQVRSGTFLSNVLNGYSNFDGSDFTITSNVANGGIAFSGTGNKFSSNILNQVYFTNNDIIDGGGNIFNYAPGSKRVPSLFDQLWLF